MESWSGRISSPLVLAGPPSDHRRPPFCHASMTTRRLRRGHEQPRRRRSQDSRGRCGSCSDSTASDSAATGVSYGRPEFRTRCWDPNVPAIWRKRQTPCLCPAAGRRDLFVPRLAGRAFAAPTSGGAMMRVRCRAYPCGSGRFMSAFSALDDKHKRPALRARSRSGLPSRWGLQE